MTRLRQQAEDSLKAIDGTAPGLSTAGDQRLVHELQVRQIQLEMQNEELRRAQLELSESRDRYAELYDFAPVGYLTIDPGGRIVKANLTAARMLGVERGVLVGNRNVSDFVAPESQDEWYRKRHAIFADRERQTCELAFRKGESAPRFVRLDGVALHGEAEAPSQAFVTLTDIADRRRIEDALRFLAQCGSNPSGEDFFRVLPPYLARSLGMEFVCIDRLEEGLLAARTVAVYYDGEFDDNLSYALKDTPCGAVVAADICCFPRDVRHLFPKDAVLRKMRAESYVGTIVRSSRGEPIGLIAVIGRLPLANPEVARSILQLVAVRVAAELERMQADEQRAAVHRRTLAILESISDGFFSLDRQWRVTFINSRGVALLGKSHAELLGRSLWDCFPDAAAAPFRQAYERALAEQVTTSIEAFYPPLNAWFEARAYPSPDGLSVFYQNITDRKHAQAEIESLARFPEENPAAVLRILADGTLAYANPASDVLLTALDGQRGLPAPETLRQPALAALTSGQKQDIEFECAGRVYGITCAPVPDSGYANIYGRDVTERRAAETAARQALDRAHEAMALATASRAAADTLSAMGEGVMLLRMDGSVLSINPALRRMIGYHDEELVGKPLEPYLKGFIAEGDRHAVVRLLRCALAGDPGCVTAFTLVGRQGNRLPVLSGVSFIRGSDDQPTAVVVTLRDVSELHGVHRRLREFAARLAVSEEEDRWRISRYIHDTIVQDLSLSSILLGSMAASRTEPGQQRGDDQLCRVRGLLDHANDECRMVMSDLTPSLLYELGLVPALRDLAHRMAAKHGGAVTVEDHGREISLPHPLRGLLFQCIRELVMNALKHAGPCKIGVSVNWRGTALTVRVEDDGAGFDPATMDSAVDRTGGFGLFSIRQRLEGLGGQLELESAPGEGTVATIILPKRESAGR